MKFSLSLKNLFSIFFYTPLFSPSVSWGVQLDWSFSSLLIPSPLLGFSYRKIMIPPEL